MSTLGETHTDTADLAANTQSVRAWQIARAIQTTTDGAMRILFALVATWQLTPTAASAVIAAGLAVDAVCTLPAGTLADRHNTRTMLLVWLTAELVVAVVGAVALLSFTPASPLAIGWTLAVIAGAFGLCNAFSRTAYSTVIVQLVPEELLTKTMAEGQVYMRLAGVLAGPVAAGAVVAFGLTTRGMAYAFVCHVVGLVVCLAATARWMDLRYPKEQSTHSMWHDAREGLRLVRTPGRVRTVILALIGANVWATPVLGVGMALAAAAASTSPTWVGWAQATIGIAAALTVFLLGRVGTLTGSWPFVALSAQGVALMMVGWGTPLALCSAGVLVGITAGAASLSLGRTLAGIVPKEQMGRTFSTLALTDVTLVPLTTLLIGIVASSYGPGIACVALGLCSVILFARSAIIISAQQRHNPK